MLFENLPVPGQSELPQVKCTHSLCSSVRRWFTTDAYPDVPQELHFGVREGAQSRRRLRRGHRQGMMIPLLQFLRLLPRHRHLVQQRQDVGPLGLRGEKERRI